MKIVRAHQTSWACPSQWDAYDDQGNYWYLRFRHGWGEATQYPSSDIDTWDWSQGRPAPDYEFYAGDDGLDGVIDLQDFCDRAGIELDLDTRETSVYEFWPYKDLEMGP